MAWKGNYKFFHCGLKWWSMLQPLANQSKPLGKSHVRSDRPGSGAPEPAFWNTDIFLHFLQTCFALFANLFCVFLHNQSSYRAHSSCGRCSMDMGMSWSEGESPNMAGSCLKKALLFFFTVFWKNWAPVHRYRGSWCHPAQPQLCHFPCGCHVAQDSHSLIVVLQLQTCDESFSTTRAAGALVPLVSGTFVRELCQDVVETFQEWQVTFQIRNYAKLHGLVAEFDLWEIQWWHLPNMVTAS